ncbi:hypothetical protein COU80_05385 [Candidatus Peregrinibacteria bacterium CG10_big_fil_rev_8_21_14_0_10_55_24]|nr:MAG: hypothetical protein COU80_05385 [Candidatus Peregrinibacteria bacterium CG10_big_fil_rev_8_21_14_0_10_55_24]
MKPRIVILSAFLTPFRSGAEACAEEVPLALVDQYDFTIVTARGRRSLPKRDRLQGKIDVVRVGLGFGLGIDKWLFPFLAPFAVRRLQPQIIHAVLETFAGLALVFCRWTFPSAKRMLTLQTTNRSFLKGMIVRSADQVTAISSVLINKAAELGRSDAVLIPNGIPLTAIHSAVEKNKRVSGRVLFVGRLEKVKGVDVLLKAFAMTLDDLKKANITKDALLRIAGDGSQRRSLENLARQLNIADRVTFLGYVPSPQIYDEYAQAEIFCGLSRSEAFGNVFLEAQAAGCVTIFTQVGGISDIHTHGKAAWGVQPDDVEGTKEALRAFLLDEEGIRTQFAAKAQSHAQAYDWHSIAARYGSLYDRLLSRTS